MRAVAPKSVLRNILRRLRTQTALVGDSSLPTRQYVLKQYRLNQSAQGEKATMLQKFAMDYSALLTDLQERKKLHELDVGLESEISQKEMSRRAAARVGLQLPKLNP
jgi:hypothetical protein